MPATHGSPRFFSKVFSLGSAIVVLGFASFAITLTPSSHDFGRAAVGGLSPDKVFRVAIPGVGPSDKVTAVIAGANADDFIVGGDCSAWYTGGSCDLQVAFSPKEIGARSARLEVTDKRGNKATATLTGTGVAAICEPIVVSCNYAFLYDGTFNWGSTLSAGSSISTQNVTVSIVRGRGACNGAATSAFEGKTRTGPITGPALVAVEFDRGELSDSTKAGVRPIYRITVACPTPAWPATDDGVGTASQPAELGHNDQSTYNQAADHVGMDLIGSNSYPAPEADPINGVTGNVKVFWTLKRAAPVPLAINVRTAISDAGAPLRDGTELELSLLVTLGVRPRAAKLVPTWPLGRSTSRRESALIVWTYFGHITVRNCAIWCDSVRNVKRASL